MRTTYQPLCSIEQQHSYFQNESTPSVSILPTPETARRLQRAGLFVKTTAIGPVVLRTAPDGVAALPLPAFLLPLRFQVQPLSPYFGNFTELPGLASGLPANQASLIYYFGVPPTQANAAPGAGTLAELKAADGLQLPLTPLSLTFQTDQAAVASTRVNLLALSRQEPLKQALPLDEAGRVVVDLRRWGSGRYQLKAGNKVLYDFYADGQLYATRAWGILEVGAAALSQPPLHGRLCFAARRTRWQYLFQYKYAAAEKYRQAPASLTVVAVGGAQLPPISFEQTPPPPGVDVAFVSREAVALAERPGYACTLRFALPAPTVVARLPGAGIEMVRPAPGAAPKATPAPAYSDIFVHL